MNWIKSNPVIFILIVILFISLLVYFFGREKKPTSEAIIISDFPLKYGSTGIKVSSLQKYLNKNHNCGLIPDGIFGRDTEKCVQSIFGVIEVDETTYKKLEIDSVLFNVNDLASDATEALSGWFGKYQIVYPNQK